MPLDVAGQLCLVIAAFAAEPEFQVLVLAGMAENEQEEAE